MMTIETQTKTRRKVRGRNRKKGKGLSIETAEAQRRDHERVEFETLEFIQAIDRFKRKTLKIFPSWSEVLDILRSLGYQKVAG